MNKAKANVSLLHLSRRFCLCSHELESFSSPPGTPQEGPKGPAGDFPSSKSLKPPGPRQAQDRPPQRGPLEALCNPWVTPVAHRGGFGGPCLYCHCRAARHSSIGFPRIHLEAPKGPYWGRARHGLRVRGVRLIDSGLPGASRLFWLISAPRLLAMHEVRKRILIEPLFCLLLLLLFPCCSSCYCCCYLLMPLRLGGLKGSHWITAARFLLRM